MSIDGTLEIASGLVGTDVNVHANGPDLAAVAAMAGVENVPSERFSVEGAVRVVVNGYELRNVEAQVGDITMNARGRLGLLPEIAGTDLDVHFDGPDLSYVGALAGRMDLPAVPFRVDVGAAVLESGYELRGIDLRVGDLRAKADGRLGPVPDLDGTSLRVEARLPKLSAIGSYVDRTLPDEPVAVRGSVAVEQDVYHLEKVEIRLGDNRLGAEGKLVPTDGLVGTELVIDIAVPGPLGDRPLRRGRRIRQAFRRAR